MVTTFLMPFSEAQSAIGTTDCARVKLVRAMYGDFSVMIKVPAAVTISGVFDSADTEATEKGHLLVDDELLRDALGVVGNRGIVPDDELDLLAGNGVAVLRHVELD